MRVVVSGQKWFGAEVAASLLDGGHELTVCAPLGDRLHTLAERLGLAFIDSASSLSSLMPDCDLIVAAHSHAFISEKARLRARFGGIGYHPSLLPLHRGRDAVRWSIKMGDRVTGGSVYRLTNTVDGGAVLAQQHVFIKRGDNADELWRRDLAPLGVTLLRRVVDEIGQKGYIHGVEQDEADATWEPSFQRPPLARPDLILLGYTGEQCAAQNQSQK